MSFDLEVILSKTCTCKARFHTQQLPVVHSISDGSYVAQTTRTTVQHSELHGFHRGQGCLKMYPSVKKLATTDPVVAVGTNCQVRVPSQTSRFLRPLSQRGSELLRCRTKLPLLITNTCASTGSVSVSCGEARSGKATQAATLPEQ